MLIFVVQLGIDHLCVNPSRDSQFSWLKSHLDHLLSRNFVSKNLNFQQIQYAFQDYQKIYDKHLTYEKSVIEDFILERDYYRKFIVGKRISLSTKKMQDRIMKAREQYKIPLWQQLNSYYLGVKYVRKFAKQTLQLVNNFMMEQGVKNHRSALRNYLSFLRSRDQNRKKNLAKNIDYNAILGSFPVWLVKTNDISRVLPLKKEVFDLLIIDEASQCDIPSIIPLIQRAKKVINLSSIINYKIFS